LVIKYFLLLHHAKLGVESQKLGVQLHPMLQRRTPPIIMPSP